MKVRWTMFGGMELQATLSSMPSQMARDGTQVVLEIAPAGPMAPIMVTPGSAQGITIIEATASEIEALRNAGFDLPIAARRPWWKFWG